jgi:hypothetical protein
MSNVHPTRGSSGALRAANPYAEYEALKALAGASGLEITERDDEKLCEDGPATATERLKYLLKARDIAIPEPAPQPSASAKTTESKTSSAKTETKTKRAKNATGPVNGTEAYSLKGGFFKVPNDVADELIAAMSAPVLKAYLYAHRLARVDGIFWISYATVAVKIGSKSPRHGRRVFVRLRKAGLVRLLNRGGAKAHKANVYQLVPLDVLDLDAVRRAVAEPLTRKSTK